MGKPETRAVDKRMRFVTGVEAREETVAALCRHFGFSRTTGYKWLERYRAQGIEGLVERSRALHEHRQAGGRRLPSAALRCATRIRRGGL